MGTAANSAFACSDLLSSILAEALRPTVEKTSVCSGLKKKVDLGFTHVTVGIDKTAVVRLQSLQYCPSDTRSQMSASIYVKCETSPDVAIHISLDETFDLGLTVDNHTCAILSFDVAPRGAIGQLIAANTDFSSQVRAEVARHITSICQPGG
jgi:hypothetical protein